MGNLISYEKFKRKQAERELRQLDEKLSNIIMAEVEKLRETTSNCDEIFGLYIRTSMEKELLLNIVAQHLGYEDLYPPKTCEKT
jgi:hypothetical protein